MKSDITVHFVGAGPGAKDLITVRGMELLKRADVVIYAGSLVNPGLLEYAADATIYDSSSMTLEEVIAVISGAAAENKTVVRLHTGDQSIYGAVREQMDELDRLGITYDSTPGVSACFGAAAELDMEYTLPKISQSLIITRMSGRTGVPDRESIRSFAAHRASMAIYLSGSMTEKLSKELIAGGYPPDTPCAISYKATWDDGKHRICTVGTLHDTAQKMGVAKTLVILVGDAVAQTGYERSVLYDPAYDTEYRKAKHE